MVDEVLVISSDILIEYFFLIPPYQIGGKPGSEINEYNLRCKRKYGDDKKYYTVAYKPVIYWQKSGYFIEQVDDEIILSGTTGERRGKYRIDSRHVSSFQYTRNQG